MHLQNAINCKMILYDNHKMLTISFYFSMQELFQEILYSMWCHHEVVIWDERIKLLSINPPRL